MKQSKLEIYTLFLEKARVFYLSGVVFVWVNCTLSNLSVKIRNLYAFSWESSGFLPVRSSLCVSELYFK